MSRTNEGKKLQHTYEISGYVGQTRDLQGEEKQHHKVPSKTNQNQRGNGFLNSKTRSQNTRKKSFQRSSGKQPASQNRSHEVSIEPNCLLSMKVGNFWRSRPHKTFSSPILPLRKSADIQCTLLRGKEEERHCIKEMGANIGELRNSIGC